MAYQHLSNTVKLIHKVQFLTSNACLKHESTETQWYWFTHKESR